MLPRVLVLMATYNGRAWVLDQIYSILNQKDVYVNIVVGDDLSTDGTAEIVQSICDKDERVVLKRWNEQSGSAGANFRRLYETAELTACDYVALADQDDYWIDSKLIAGINVLLQEGVQGYSCAAEAVWANGKSKVLKQMNRLSKLDYLFEGAGQGCTFVLPVDSFKLVQSFCVQNRAVVDLIHYHDWLIYIIIRMNNGEWFFDQRSWIRYRQHDNNEIGARMGVRGILKRVKLIKGGWFKMQIIVALRIANEFNSDDRLLNDFRTLFNSPTRMHRRIHLFWYLLMHSRRRLSDRLIVSLSALLGWI